MIIDSDTMLIIGYRWVPRISPHVCLCGMYIHTNSRCTKVVGITEIHDPCTEHFFNQQSQ